MDDVIVIDDEEEERTFEDYLNLPWHMRSPIIDRMWPKERRLPCRPPYKHTRYDDSIDFLEYSVEHFKNLLRHYHKSIKSLDIYGELFSRSLGSFDFGVDHLNNLEELAISTVYMEHLLPKIRHPLKKLIIHGETSDANIANNQQIYQVQGEVQLLYTGFNNEQLHRISARIATTHIGQLTVDDIYNWIRCWQYGTLGKRVARHVWEGLETANFDHEELFRRFGGLTNHSWITIEEATLRTTGIIEKRLHFVVFRQHYPLND